MVFQDLALWPHLSVRGNLEFGRKAKRIAKAERGVPTMQATIACVSGYGRQQVRQMDLAPPVSYARHAQRMPSCSLDRHCHRARA